MTVQRIVFSCALAASPLLACGSTPTQEQPDGDAPALRAAPFTHDGASTQHALLSPSPVNRGPAVQELACAAGPQRSEIWYATNETIDDTIIWYPLGNTATDAYGQTWTSYAGVDTNDDPIVYQVVWVPTNVTGNFQWFNAVCNPGPGPGPHYDPPPPQNPADPNTPAGIGTGPIIRILILPAPPGVSPLPCVEVGTIDSLIGANNACASYDDTFWGIVISP